jgi:hypothetical protein
MNVFLEYQFVQDAFWADNKAVQYKLCDYKLSIMIVFVCTTITVCETKKMSDALLTLNVAADSSKKSGQGVTLSKITTSKVPLCQRPPLKWSLRQKSNIDHFTNSDQPLIFQSKTFDKVINHHIFDQLYDFWRSDFQQSDQFSKSEVTLAQNRKFQVHEIICFKIYWWILPNF